MLLRLNDWIARALLTVAAVLAFLLCFLVCADVIGRYFLNAPVYGAFEITETLLAGLIFCALPLVTLRGDHVTVDIFDNLIPEWLARVQHVLVCLVSFAATAFLAWRLWLRAVGMDAAGETTAQLKFKLAYLTYAMSLLMACSALAVLVLALRPPPRHPTAEV